MNNVSELHYSASAILYRGVARAMAMPHCHTIHRF